MEVIAAGLVRRILSQFRLLGQCVVAVVVPSSGFLLLELTSARGVPEGDFGARGMSFSLFASVTVPSVTLRAGNLGILGLRLDRAFRGEYVENMFETNAGAMMIEMVGLSSMAGLTKECGVQTVQRT
jgi:hypothetical protein